MIHLFSLIAEQVQNRQDLFTNEGKIMDALISSGCHLKEADTALTLMQALVQEQSEQLLGGAPASRSFGIRAMNAEERSRLAMDAFGFVSKLTLLGIITEDQREELLEKAMTIYAGRIHLDQIKTLIAYILFAHSQDHENVVLSALRRIKNTAWN